MNDQGSHCYPEAAADRGPSAQPWLAAGAQTVQQQGSRDRDQGVAAPSLPGPIGATDVASSGPAWGPADRGTARVAGPGRQPRPARAGWSPRSAGCSSETAEPLAGASRTHHRRQVGPLAYRVRRDPPPCGRTRHWRRRRCGGRRRCRGGTVPAEMTSTQGLRPQEADLLLRLQRRLARTTRVAGRRQEGEDPDRRLEGQWRWPPQGLGWENHQKPRPRLGRDPGREPQRRDPIRSGNRGQSRQERRTESRAQPGHARIAPGAAPDPAGTDKHPAGSKQPTADPSQTRKRRHALRCAESSEPRDFRVRFLWAPGQRWGERGQEDRAMSWRDSAWRPQSSGSVC